MQIKNQKNTLHFYINMVNYNCPKEELRMTRGQITIVKDGYKEKEVITSIEFNGDMYMPDGKWDGHGQRVIDLLKKANDTADYQWVVAKFNKENHHYNDCESLTYKLEKGVKTLDFTKDYFDNWFSDYVYLKNLTKESIKLTTRVADEEGNDIGKKEVDLEPNQIAVLCFGRLVKIEK